MILLNYFGSIINFEWVEFANLSCYLRGNVFKTQEHQMEQRKQIINVGKLPVHFQTV